MSKLERKIKLKLRKKEALSEREMLWAELNIFKECKRCLKDRPLKHYYKLKNGKYGRNCICSKCRREINREKYEQNKEKYEEYYENNQDKRAEYYLKNREKRLAYQHEYIEKKKLEKIRVKLEKRKKEVSDHEPEYEEQQKERKKKVKKEIYKPAYDSGLAEGLNSDSDDEENIVL